MSYRSHADLGGTAGHGRVVPEPVDARFHADWERSALALTLAMGASGAWNIDMSRRARETLPDYDSLSYYARWIEGMRALLVERGLVGDDEIAAGRMLHPARALPHVLKADEVAAVLARGSPTLRDARGLPPRFAAGARVRTRAAEVPHHTRLPGYARGKLGTIERLCGVHVFADTYAHGLGEAPQWLYTVAFEGSELWGEDAAAGLTVSIDAWESYLEPA